MADGSLGTPMYFECAKLHCVISRSACGRRYELAQFAAGHLYGAATNGEHRAMLNQSPCRTCPTGRGNAGAR